MDWGYCGFLNLAGCGVLIKWSTIEEEKKKRVFRDFYYPLVCQSAQEIGGNKSQFEILLFYFQLWKDTSQIPLFSWPNLKFS